MFYLSNNKATRLLVGFGFCLSFAMSFVLMSKVVQNDGPVFSALMTYGLSQCFLIAIRWRYVGKMLNAARSDFPHFLALNILTLANTLLVYVIFTHVTAFTYVLIFFGTLSCSALLISRIVTGQGPWANLEHIIAFVAISLGVLRIITNGPESRPIDSLPVLGIVLTLAASLAGAAYLVISLRFQKRTNLSSVDIVALRFTVTVIVCLMWLVSTKQDIQVDLSGVVNYIVIAFLGSIIPLYLLQISNELSGALGTSLYMAFIPLFCIALSSIFVHDSVSSYDVLFSLVLTGIIAVRYKQFRKSLEQREGLNRIGKKIV